MQWIGLASCVKRTPRSLVAEQRPDQFSSLCVSVPLFMLRPCTSASLCTCCPRLQMWVCRHVPLCVDTRLCRYAFYDTRWYRYHPPSPVCASGLGDRNNGSDQNGRTKKEPKRMEFRTIRWIQMEFPTIRERFILQDGEVVGVLLKL